MTDGTAGQVPSQDSSHGPPKATAQPAVIVTPSSQPVGDKPININITLSQTVAPGDVNPENKDNNLKTKCNGRNDINDDCIATNPNATLSVKPNQTSLPSSDVPTETVTAAEPSPAADAPTVTVDSTPSTVDSQATAPTSPPAASTTEDEETAMTSDGPSMSPLRIPVDRFNVHSWRVPIQIGETKLTGLLDSGAQVTLVNKETLLALPVNCRTLRASNAEIVGVHGDSRTCDGVATIPITMGSKQYSVDVVVAPTKDSVIIGMNLITQVGAVIDFSKGILKIGHEELILTREQVSPKSTRLCTRRAQVVLPYNESIIPLRTISGRKNDSVDSTYIVKPLQAFLGKTGLLMGKTLVNTDTLYAIVVNPTSSVVHINRGDHVAYAAPAELVYGALRRDVDPTSTDDVDVNVLTDLPDLLRPLVEETDLSHAQKAKCAQLLLKYQDIFASSAGRLGRTNVTTHRIDTGTHAPVRQRMRPIPLAQQDLVDREIDKMLSLGVIEPSNSPWSSPIVLARKKTGEIRFCVDFRSVNSITKKDSYPLPNILQTFNTLRGAQYFSTLDLASGYWQIEMHPEDKAKTAFPTKRGLFQFTTMPFGLCNAPATFERLMDTVLRGYLWERCMCYLDDIVVYGHTFETALQNLQLVFERLRQAGLRLKPSKCQLFKRELLYLGFIVNGQGTRPDPEKLKALRQWPIPCTVTDVRSFLGFANYHRRFIKDYAKKAEGLLQLTRGQQNFQWGPTQRKSFNLLRDSLEQIPFLSHPEPSDKHEFILDTDASGFALGGALYQSVDGVERPIGFASKTLSRSQRNYCTTYRELLAIVEMIKHFRHYLWGRHFRLRTDHGSLRWLRSYKDAEGMLARWLAKLQQYDFDIEHRPGVRHVNADSLSRCHSCKNEYCPGNITPAPSEPETSSGELPATTVKPHSKASSTKRIKIDDLEPNVVIKPVPERTLSLRQLHRVRNVDTKLNRLSWLTDYSRQDLQAAQETDSSVGLVYKWVSTGTRPSKEELARQNEEVKTLVSRWKQLSIHNGLLIRTITENGNNTPILQTVLPSPLRQVVLHQLHDLRLVGHLGIQRTIARVRRRYYWPGLSLDVSRWCASCPECAGRKGKPPPRRAPLTQKPTGAPFDRIAMDILDTHRPAAHGYRYILVISDYFSKYSDAFPLRRHTAKNVAQLLMTRWITYHGIPKVIHTDQGTEFESSLMKNLARLLDIKKTRTSPYRPQSDGLVERLNRSILAMLSAFVTDRGNDWDTHLPYVMMAYRSSVHASTGCSPQIMVYGREMCLPVDLMFPSAHEEDNPPCGPAYVEYLRRAITSAHLFARDHLQKAAQRQKKGYDAYTRDRPAFQDGDLVRYFYLPLTQGNKFARPWTGPWRIISKVTDVDYRISLVSQPAKTRVVHVDYLKPFERQEIPSTNIDRNDDVTSQSPDEPLSDIGRLYRPWPVQRPVDATTSHETSSDEEQDLSPGGNPPVLPERLRRRPVADYFNNHRTTNGSELTSSPTHSTPRPRRSRRARKPPQRYGFT